MSWRRRSAVLLASAALLAFQGCCESPESENARAEARVRKAAPESIHPLAPADLNALILPLKSDKYRWTPAEFYQVTGEVVRIEMRVDSCKSGSRRELRVTLMVPEYAAANVVCNFAPGRERFVLGLQVGQTTAVRGNLKSVTSSASLELVGCIPVEEQARD
jgi:hypothetical protein